MWRREAYYSKALEVKALLEWASEVKPRLIEIRTKALKCIIRYQLYGLPYEGYKID